MYHSAYEDPCISNPLCIRGSVAKKLHMGIPICIRSMYAYGTVINICASYLLEKTTIFTVFELYIYFMAVFLEVIGDS